ncbi:hypothetical protein KOI35_17595 [Actinoplanes bogorensis]|uniref:histidine kinase n=1 Tax=Paractinoplanes bogorensis TaxID=1610840 RepID=A0ABS5YPD3_9ACTN|nr:ATP-binding protein [Actinoplanes bogorensis]MBU2665322.1 hypothetical protein [Actinoplanes bogorensis]
MGRLDRLGDLIDGQPVEVVIEGRERPLPQVVDASAYRIVQEALTNARRHAPGRPVTLTLSYRPAELGLRVVNAAGGPAGRGHGLPGMRERAALLGGTLTAGPAGDGTFVVAATLPAS